MPGRILLAAALALVVSVALATPAAARVSVSLPGIEPAFSPAVHDYVIGAKACSKRFPLTVRTPGSPAGASARIGAGGPTRGRQTRRLRLRAGQAISVTYRRGPRRASTYWFRCLPRDFPEYSYERLGKPRIPFFAIANSSFSTDPPHTYVMVFDARGVPVWWYDTEAYVVNPFFLPGGNIAWAIATGGRVTTDPRAAYVVHRLDATRVRALRAKGSPTDQHDLQKTEDGNFLLFSYRRRCCLDLRAFNGDRRANVYDAVIQKVSPAGRVLWSWNSKNHIGLRETGRWWPELEEEPYDLVHINAIEETPNGDYLISARHLDAVYRIDGRTGAVEWKLGGTRIPRSLTVKGDPLAHLPLAGQHDVRLLGDGTVSVFDNATNIPERLPRAVQYRVSGTTATLMRSITEPLARWSFFAGSARHWGRSWLISWGGRNVITEVGPDGRREFLLRLGPEEFSYRAFPAGRGLTSRRALRAGMNAQVAPKR